MKQYNWQQHFDASFATIASKDGFYQYHIKNDSGDGVITACTVFWGIQAIKCDQHMLHSSVPVKQNKNVIEANFCLDGRYECPVSKRYCFYVSSGDFSVGFAGRKEAGGTTPTGQYQGINIFIEIDAFLQHHADILQDLKIDMENIRSLAATTPRYFVLHQEPNLDNIRRAFVKAFNEKSIPHLKIKVLELMLFLNSPDVSSLNDPPVYLNKNSIALAEAAHQLLIQNLSRRMTIEQLAEELDTGITTLKRSFKSVYGIPIFQYQKELRLQEAQRLLHETDNTVSEIAAAINYSNPAKFSSAFKTRFGMSPTEYRIRNRSKANTGYLPYRRD